MVTYNTISFRFMDDSKTSEPVFFKIWYDSIDFLKAESLGVSVVTPSELHPPTCKRLAQTECVSVNQLVSSALAEKLSALDAERYLNERAARGREVDINTILAKVPNTEPDLEDRISLDAKHP